MRITFPGLGVALISLLLSGCGAIFLHSNIDLGSWGVCPEGFRVEGNHEPLVLPTTSSMFHGNPVVESTVTNHVFNSLTMPPSVYTGINDSVDWFVSGYKMVIAHTNGVLSMYDKGDLVTPQWSFSLAKLKLVPQFIKLSYVPSKDLILVTTGGDHLYAINLKNGKIAWKKQLRAPLHERVVVSGEKLLFSTVDNYFYVVSAENGQVMWGYQGEVVPVRSAVDHSVVVSDNFAYFFSQGGTFYAFDLDLGELVWQLDTENPRENNRYPVGLVSPVAISAEDKIVVNTSKGFCHVINSNKGSYLNKIDCKSVMEVRLVKDKALLLTKEGKLRVVSLETSEELWSVDMSSSYTDSSVVGSVIFDNIFWMVGSNGHFIGIDLFSGKCVRDWRPVSKVSHLPVIALGKMYLYNGAAFMVVG